ncbi:MAG TPA: nitronate monooxygenase family protein [Solirubrobacterales bacterium]|nr:nitronate monooxygenase family protein [Solirubrobacterales bacterium]
MNPAQHPSLRTQVTELLGVTYPLLAFSHSKEVVVAVSRAGGLGVLGAAQCSVEELEQKLAWLEQELGDVPFGVDLLLPGRYEKAEEGGLQREELIAQVPSAHREFVADLMDQYAVPELEEGYEFGDIVDGGGVPVTGNHTYTAKDTQPLIDVCLNSKIALFANALGVAPREVIDSFHDHGILVAGLAGTARHGEKHKQAGTDIVIAQGYEAGGHTGEIGSMVLIPDVVDAVEGLPVLAAGGIASGRQMAAAMVLGASGVWTGSVWLTTEESEVIAPVKEKFVDAVAAETVRSRSCTGRPARQLRSAWTDAWEGEIEPLGMPHQGILYAEPQVRIARGAEADAGRSRELATYFVGQVVGRLDRIRPASEVVEEMVTECAALLTA